MQLRFNVNMLIDLFAVLILECAKYMKTLNKTIGVNAIVTLLSSEL